MELYKLIAVVFSATGFWKLIEILSTFRSDRRLKAAQAQNLLSQTQSSMVENWVQWSQKLEARVKELEAVAVENEDLKQQVDRQRQRILELEQKVEQLHRENLELKEKLSALD